MESIRAISQRRFGPRLALGAAIVLSLLQPASAAAPRPIPWQKLHGADELMQNERDDAAAVMRAFACYGPCTASIAECLARSPRSPIAWRLADYVLFLAAKGLSRQEMLQILELRRESAVPKTVATIAAGDSPRLGGAEAKVVIVEFADLQCGHCAAIAPLLKKIVARHKGQVALVFKPYPLRPGPPVVATRAALAAQRQGKFWQLQPLLFENPEQHDDKGVEALARQAKLDLARFRVDFRDKALLQRIDEAKVAGLKLGIKGTPTLYVNGKLYLLIKDERHLEERIAEELDLLAAAPR